MSDEQRTVFGYLFELDVAVGRIVAAVNAAGAPVFIKSWCLPVIVFVAC
jgi:hypothetical protein